MCSKNSILLIFFLKILTIQSNNLHYFATFHQAHRHLFITHNISELRKLPDVVRSEYRKILFKERLSVFKKLQEKYTEIKKTERNK